MPHVMRRPTSHAGLTLVEVLIGSALLSVVIGAAYTVLSAGERSTRANLAYIEVSEEARRGMERMINELRHAQRNTVNIINTPTGDQITFQVPGNPSPIQYAVGGADGTSLLRTENGVSTVICNNVQRVQFGPSPFSGQVISIVLQVQRTSSSDPTLSTTLQGRVQVRNTNAT